MFKNDTDTRESIGAGLKQDVPEVQAEMHRGEVMPMRHASMKKDRLLKHNPVQPFQEVDGYKREETTSCEEDTIDLVTTKIADIELEESIDPARGQGSNPLANAKEGAEHGTTPSGVGPARATKARQRAKEAQPAHDKTRPSTPPDKQGAASKQVKAPPKNATKTSANPVIVWMPPAFQQDIMAEMTRQGSKLPDAKEHHRRDQQQPSDQHQHPIGKGDNASSPLTDFLGYEESDNDCAAEELPPCKASSGSGLDQRPSKDTPLLPQCPQIPGINHDDSSSEDDIESGMKGRWIDMDKNDEEDNLDTTSTTNPQDFLRDLKNLFIALRRSRDHARTKRRR
jgi:hypothetical protein